MGRYNNSRNFDGDTFDRLDQESAMPFVSPDPVDRAGHAMMPNATDDYDYVATPMAAWVDGDGDVETRGKYGPSNRGGDTSLDGGSA